MRLKVYIWLLLWKKQINIIHNTGYSLLSESHSISLLDYKTPSSSYWKMLYRPNAKTECFWNGEYVTMPQNILQHTDTWNTELLLSKTRYQSIVSLLSLYRFFFNLFSNNLLWWRQVLTNSVFLLSRLGSFSDSIM